MSLLTDASIRNVLITDDNPWFQDDRVQKEKLLITEFNEDSLTPVGYDLGVGQRYLKMYSKIREFSNLEENDKLTILPNEIVAIETEEFIGMPQNRSYSGIIVSKVTLVERGLSNISTSVDADWKGKMIITIINHSKKKIIIERKQPFCTMILFSNERPAKKTCNKHPDAHIISLIKEWELIKRNPVKVIIFAILKILIPAGFIIWLVIKYIKKEATAVDVALFVAISSFLIIALDKILKTD